MKNKVLKAVTFVAAMAWILGICCIDSQSVIPTAVCAVSSAWITLFVYANKERLG